MLAEERKQIILHLLAERRAVRVRELSDLFQITEATVRRDLDDLQQENLLQRIHGGAVPIDPVAYAGVGAFLSRNRDAKIAIAKKACEFIESYDVIALDNATTTYELMRCIKKGIQIGKLHDLTVVTHSMGLMNEFKGCDGLEIIMAGGRYDKEWDCATGEMTRDTYRMLRVDKAFFGTDAIDPIGGYSVPGPAEAAIKKCMVEIAKERYVLADHTKFNNRILERFAKATGDIDIIITDRYAEFNISFLHMSPDTEIVFAD